MRDEVRSSHYAENVRMVREKRTLYDERNLGLREGNLLPERAFEPWQAELLERSFHVEYEKGQPAYLHALLLSRETTVRSSEVQCVPEYAVEPPPHHERTRRDGVRSYHYAENVRRVREKRTLYDERNLGLREGKFTPERAFELWQEELLERSFQVEKEKGQPDYLHALLLSKETAPRAPEVLFHERTMRNDVRSSHYAERVRTIREKRTRYDERNQGLREKNYSPERAFEPWQAELLERSFQVEYEKGQPAYIHALLLSREATVRASEVQCVPEYAVEPPHHERTRRDEERNYHYAENVRIVREKRKHYDEHNQQRREGKLLPERAFQPWQEELLERSFQVEYEKGQPAYIHALLLSQRTAPRSPEVKHHPLQPERAALDRPKIVPAEERRHHSRERGEEAPEREMHVHLRAYLTILRTARKALLRLQHRLTQIWEKQLAPLIKEARRAQALQDSFKKLEKVRALQAILLVRIRQKVREAEEKQKGLTSRETLMHHIPPSIQRAMSDLEPREANLLEASLQKNQHGADHLLETERGLPPDEPITALPHIWGIKLIRKASRIPSSASGAIS